MLEWIQDIDDTMTKNYYIKKISENLSIPEKYIYSQLKPNFIKTELTDKKQVQDTVSIKLQKQIIAYLLYKPENRDILILEQSLFTQSKLRDIFVKLREYYNNNSATSLNVVECKKVLSDKEYKVLEELLLPVFYKIEQLNPNQDQINQTIKENIILLKNQYKSLVRKTLLIKLKEAKKVGDTDKIKEILKKYKSFT